MDSCLLCLGINSDLSSCIRADSKRWLELNISNAIEKHFWPLSTIQCNSWICSSCWRVVDEFHKFYLRVEKSHMQLVIKLEKGDVSELSAGKPAFGQNAKDLEADVNVKNEPVDLDDNLGTVSVNSSLKLVNVQEGNNHLEKINDVEEGKFRKRKQSREEITESKSTSEEYKTKKKRVYLDDSESITDTDDEADADINDAKSLSDTNSSDADDKYYEKNILSRDENDKIIAVYFKQIKCDVCKIPLENFFSVLRHFFEIHQQKGYIRCCKKQFFNRTDLVEHIRCHSKTNWFKCAQCDKMFSNSTVLKEHKLRTHNTEDIAKRHSSNACEKLLLNAQSLKIHKSSQWTREGKEVSCQNCNNLSLQNVDLKLYLDEMFRVQAEKMGQQNRNIMEALAAQNALTQMLIKQDEAASNLAKLFPINSEQSLMELEKQIEENSKHLYLAAVKDIIKKNICKNIGLVISEDLLYTFNTDGTHGKKRLKDFSNFYEVLKEAVRADADVDDVEGAIRKAISLIKKRHLKKILKERSIQTHTDNV